MPLVEVIPGLLTENNLAQRNRRFYEILGQISIIAKDVPGFIVNRIAKTFIIGEALRIVKKIWQHQNK